MKAATGVSVQNDFKLPNPVIEIIGKTDSLLSSHWVVRHRPYIVKFLEWNIIYFLSLFGGYGWLLFATSVYLLGLGRWWGVLTSTGYDEEFSKSFKKAEKEVLVETLGYYPSWVAFPDFDRVEWINEILRQLWGGVDSYATTFVKTFVEPKIHDILDLMQLNQVSGFQIKRVDLGSVPARVNGVKVYDKKYLAGSCEEIILDCDVAYHGDARVLFTLQGIEAQIYNVKFRGGARIHLKPLLSRFPFVGGFEFYFFNPPALDYSLGGIGTLGEVPGISGLVRSVVQDKIRSRFVWPNRFRLFFPVPECEVLDRCAYMLPKPGGLVTIELKEARNLLKKDKHFGGSGKSDPYAIVSIGERRVSFRNQYVPKTVDPVWNYSTQFLMEDPNGQNLQIEVYDFDARSADDFLGKTILPLSSLLEESAVDKWLTLSEVKHGDIHLVSTWSEAKPMVDGGGVKTCIVSVFIDSCSNLTGGKSSSLHPKCKISLNGRPDDEFTTLPRNRTENPVFEQGWLLTSKNPSEDQLSVEVIDVKGTDSPLGKVVIPISFIMDMPKCEFYGMEWPLENGNPRAKMSVSAKLYTV